MYFSTHFPIKDTVKGLKLVDYPFILAQYWKYKPYRDAYKPYGRTFGIVDNGFHELGASLSVPQVASAMLGHWAGILPDVLNRPVTTWEKAIRQIQLYGIDFAHWGIVIQGISTEQIIFQLDLAHALGFGLIAFPFKTARWEYLPILRVRLRGDRKYHLLGLSPLDTLDVYNSLPGTWSLDTGKICKTDLTKKPETWSGHYLDWKEGRVDFDLVKKNLSHLKEWSNARPARSIHPGN